MIMTPHQCKQRVEWVVKAARSPESRGLSVSPDFLKAMKKLGLEFPPDVVEMMVVDGDWLGPVALVKAEKGSLAWEALI